MSGKPGNRYGRLVEGLRRTIDILRENASLREEDLKRTLAERDEEIAKLRHEVSSMRGSTSWRVTAPLRFVPFGMKLLVGAMTNAKTRARVKAGIKRRVPARFRGAEKEAVSPYAAIWPAEDVQGSSEKWVLFAEYRLPMPENNSGSFKMFEILKLVLAQGYKVLFVSDHELDAYRLVYPDLSYVNPLRERLQKLGVPYVFGREDAIQYLRVHGLKFSAAILFYPEIASRYAPVVRAFCPRARVIFDCGDLHFLRFERQFQLSGSSEAKDKAEHYRRLETALFHECDVTLAISEKERDVIRSLVPSAHVEILRNIHPLDPPTRGYTERSGIVFVGHYLHAPNEDAAEYFAREILPLVRRSIPSAEFLVVGSNPTAKISALGSLPGVRVIGFVEDLRETLDKARVFVAPLRFGAGVKGKIGQALAFGIPVVTTDVGAEGMALTSGDTAMIANSASEFANAVVKVYESPELWSRLSSNGMKHIGAMMSSSAADEVLRRVLSPAEATK